MTAERKQPIVLPTLKHVPSPNHSLRHGDVHLVVFHRPVGSYAGSIRTLCDDTRPPRERVSAHAIMKRGGREATQLVPWDLKAWACGGFNSASDNLEIADEAWDGSDPHGLAVAARMGAFRCHKRGIPPVWTRDPVNRPGVCRHYDLGLLGGGHTDPTLDVALWVEFMAMLKHEHARGGFRPVWGIGD